MAIFMNSCLSLLSFTKYFETCCRKYKKSLNSFVENTKEIVKACRIFYKYLY